MCIVYLFRRSNLFLNILELFKKIEVFSGKISKISPICSLDCYYFPKSDILNNYLKIKNEREEKRK